MRTFEITEKEVAAAFREAESGEAKKILAALFCKEEMVKPTLDDYKTIRTYEDACKALGEPIFEDPNNLPNHITGASPADECRKKRLQTPDARFQSRRPAGADKR